MTVRTVRTRSAKSADVATIVRQRIDKGIYDHQLPGMALLADEMGLNERTVMRGVAILEGEGLVTRKRGRGTFITRLKRQRTHTIGAVIGSSSSPLGAQITGGMQAAADEARQGLTQSNYVGDLDSQLPRVRDLVERGRVDGLELWLAGLAPREGLRIGDSQSAPESDRELVAALREATAVFCETDRTAGHQKERD